ncbi:hypothetical protein [Deinococcus pimensis]|uniref:hypothetical protein n=1 Tax=Deinococcus pimensis TaxID=309888 RepID=UPI000484381E|nr:hypothetical protein [Deinococcus pimensis]
MTATLTQTRPALGDFSSVVCFKAVITGVEDTLGTDGAAVVFTRAGKVRGRALATELGVAGSSPAVEKIASILDGAIGKNGTRLCAVTASYQDGENIVIETRETVCSAGEEQGSERMCTFTLGAVWGALEAITGRTFLGEQTESVLRGGQSDKFVFSPF